MSTQRNLKGGWIDPKTLPKGENGRPLCRKCSKEVPKGKRTFCSEDCVHEWKIRTQSRYARACVKKRDKGICAICKVDTTEISKGLRAPLKGETVDQWIVRCKEVREKYNLGAHRKTAWEMDHFIPVVEGGGSCGLDNLRTLCIPCHRKVTAELAAERAKQRAKKKASVSSNE